MKGDESLILLFWRLNPGIGIVRTHDIPWWPWSKHSPVSGLGLWAEGVFYLNHILDEKPRKMRECSERPVIRINDEEKKLNTRFWKKNVNKGGVQVPSINQYENRAKKKPIYETNPEEKKTNPEKKKKTNLRNQSGKRKKNQSAKPIWKKQKKTAICETNRAREKIESFAPFWGKFWKFWKSYPCFEKILGKNQLFWEKKKTHIRNQSEKK